MASNEERHLRAILRASERIRDAEATLAQRRSDYRAAIENAHEAGLSFTVIGRALGVTRQRVKRIIEGK